MRKHIFLSILVALVASAGVLLTGCGPDTTAPAISDILVTDITGSSATITWTTNEPATSQVQYGTTTSYHTSTEFDETLKTSHSVAINKLASETAYHYIVKSADAALNLSASSDATLTTAVYATPNRIAVMVTSLGTIRIELYENRTPVTTANFIGLVESGFYDGLIFHRVIDNFMMQGGDPLGTGYGGASQTIVREIHPELKHIDGAISMARGSDPNSASSQFFICDGAQDFLDGDYAVFGQVIAGIDVVHNISAVETHNIQIEIEGVTTSQRDVPVQDVIITSVTIE